jgi:hypothetical protein
MWEYTSAYAHEDKASRLCEQGWEPFAVTWQEMPNQRHVIWFRRQAPRHTGDNKTDQ